MLYEVTKWRYRCNTVQHQTGLEWSFILCFVCTLYFFIDALYLFYSLFLYSLFILVVYCDLILSFFLCLDPIEIYPPIFFIPYI